MHFFWKKKVFTGRISEDTSSCIRVGPDLNAIVLPLAEKCGLLDKEGRRLLWDDPGREWKHALQSKQAKDCSNCQKLGRDHEGS